MLIYIYNISSIKDLTHKFSEPFLHFLEDNYSNETQKTFCEGNSQSFHESNYIWCKISNKIFWTKCSLHHLLNNQINHNPNDRIFLGKEYFDIEYVRDCEKMNYLKRKVDDYFSDNEKIDYNLLLQISSKFMDLSNELATILNEFLLKILKSLDNIEPKNRNTIWIGMKEDKVCQNFTKISNKFKTFGDNYYSS